MKNAALFISPFFQNVVVAVFEFSVPSPKKKPSGVPARDPKTGKGKFF